MKMDLNEILRRCCKECPDFVPDAIWTIKECEDDSVEIKVEVKKNLVISNRVSKDYTGKSTTQKTEEAISNAVQALNEELLSLLQNDNIA